MTIYERIKKRRKELGLTADQVADSLGISRAAEEIHGEEKFLFRQKVLPERLKNKKGERTCSAPFFVLHVLHFVLHFC